MSPSYHFECGKCGYSEDSFRSINTPKVSKCPNCSEVSLVRCISGGCGFRISGGGVYNSGFKHREDKEDG